MSESQFVDDLALHAVDWIMFESAGRKFVQVRNQFGLTVIIPKIKGLAVGMVSEGDVSPVEIGSGMVEIVKDFTYLGSNLSSDCEATCEIKCRIAEATKEATKLPFGLETEIVGSLNWVVWMRAAPLNNFFSVNCYEGSHSVGDLRAIGVAVLGMGGFRYARIISSGRKYVAVLLTFFLHNSFMVFAICNLFNCMHASS